MKSGCCSCDGFVSAALKRHHMAVLRQCQRCLQRNIGTDEALDVESVCEAINYLVEYAKKC